MASVGTTQHWKINPRSISGARSAIWATASPHGEKRARKNLGAGAAVAG